MKVKKIVSFILLFLTVQVLEIKSANLWIDNFEDGDLTGMIAGDWTREGDGVDDEVVKLTNGYLSLYALRFEYNNDGTWVLVSDQIGPGWPPTPVDCSAYEGIHFWIRTGSGTLPVKVDVCLTNIIGIWDWHHKDITPTTTWTEYFIPFTSLSQHTPTKPWNPTMVYKIQFSCDIAGNSDWIEVDDIYFYQSTNTNLLPNPPSNFIANNLYDISKNPDKRPKLVIRLNETKKVDVKIYNINGNLITTLLNESLSKGVYEKEWDLKDFNGIEVSAGVYIVKMEIGDKIITQKIVVIK